MPEGQMTGDEWIQSFAAELGVEPLGADEVQALLDLASVAAHASERLAAPLSCYLAARAGVAPEAALAAAHRLAGSTP
jgi:hypothetical protein